MVQMKVYKHTGIFLSNTEAQNYCWVDLIVTNMKSCRLKTWDLDWLNKNKNITLDIEIWLKPHRPCMASEIFNYQAFLLNLLALSFAKTELTQLWKQKPVLFSIQRPEKLAYEDLGLDLSLTQKFKTGCYTIHVKIQNPDIIKRWTWGPAERQYPLSMKTHFKLHVFSLLLLNTLLNGPKVQRWIFDTGPLECIHHFWGYRSDRLH